MTAPPPARPCIICGQFDDHPRHIIYRGDFAAMFHFDCHSLVDPPCEVCTAQIAGAEGATGDALREYLQRGVTE